MLFRRLWRIPIWLATGVFGAWVADLYLPGFELDGSLTARLIVGGVVAGLFMAAAVVIALVVLLPITALMTIGSITRIEPMPPDGVPPKIERVPHPVAKAIGTVVTFVVLNAVVAPVSAFLAVRACQVVGLPVEFAGGWREYFTIALVLNGVQGSTQAILAPNNRNRAWVASRLAFLAGVVVLWLAAELGVAVHPGTPADILVLAAMLDSVRLRVADRWGMAVQAPADLAAMWVLAWSSALLVSPLEFTGPGPLVLTAVALTAITLPLWLLAPPSPQLDGVRAGQR